MQSIPEQRRPKLDLLPSLTGMRAIAAFMVFGLHFLFMQFATPVGATTPGVSDLIFILLFANGGVGVTFFFVLSGFVLTWATSPEQGASEFWWRRFAKIYPVVVVTTLAAFVGFGLIHQQWTSWNVVLTNLLLVQAWSPDQAYSLALNPVLWSLSCEAFFYLIFPALLPAFTRASKRALWLTGAGCVALTFLLPRVAERMFTLRPPEPVVRAPLEGFDTGFSFWFTSMFPLMRLTEFLLGMVLATLMLRGARPRINVPVALAICLVCLGFNLFLPGYLRTSAFMLIPFTLLIAALARADVYGGWSPVRSPTMVFLGKISYCFYAVHVLFFIFTVVFPGAPDGAHDYPRRWLANAGLIADPTVALPHWANVLLFLAYLAVAGTAAWLLYVTVEVPMTRRLRRLRRPALRPTPPAPVEAVPSTASLG